jgi:hypothetical protein
MQAPEELRSLHRKALNGIKMADRSNFLVDTVEPAHEWANLSRRKFIAASTGLAGSIVASHAQPTRLPTFHHVRTVLTSRTARMRLISIT